MQKVPKKEQNASISTNTQWLWQLHLQPTLPPELQAGHRAAFLTWSLWRNTGLYSLFQSSSIQARVPVHANPHMHLTFAIMNSQNSLLKVGFGVENEPGSQCRDRLGVGGP